MPQKRKQKNQPSFWVIVLVVLGIRHNLFYINLKSLSAIPRRSLIGSGFFTTQSRRFLIGSCFFHNTITQISDWSLFFHNTIKQISDWFLFLHGAVLCLSLADLWLVFVFPQHNHADFWLVLVFTAQSCAYLSQISDWFWLVLVFQKRIHYKTLFCLLCLFSQARWRWVWFRWEVEVVLLHFKDLQSAEAYASFTQ